MKKVISVFTGMNIVDDYNAHPVKQVEFAKDCVEEVSKNGGDVLVNSNSLDFCSSVFYIAEAIDKDIKVKFYIDGELVNGLEEVFEKFNESFELLDKIVEEKL